MNSATLHSSISFQRMNKNKISVFLPIFFSVAVILGMLIGYKLHSNMPTTKSFFGNASSSTVNEILQLVKQRYVDTVDSKALSNSAVASMLEKLDPHSIYIPSQDVNEINEDLEGNFQGIGIEFNVMNDTVNVFNIIKGGPSQAAGLEIGDKILKVDDRNAVGLKDSDQFKKWVKGPQGTSVTLTILRGDKSFTKKIMRDYVPVTSLDAYYMIDKNKGYIRLNRFSNNTYKEFIEALEYLKSKGMNNLVLDLRDNGGGILEEAVDIIDELVGGDQLLVYTEGINSPKKEYKAKRKGIFEDGKIVIILNEGSASASEVIAGALQDLDRAEIVGRRSFGKGLVQEQFTLSDGAALRLTTARYYTPLGRSIQKPYDKGVDQYAMEVMERYHNTQSQSIDSLSIEKGRFVTTKKGKKLYGGGGITPDQFVPLEQYAIDSNLNIFFRLNMLNNFSYLYYLQHKKAIKDYPSFQQFHTSFQVEESSIAQLIKEAEKLSSKKIILNKEQINFLKERIRALIARFVWNQTGFYYVINGTDKTYIKATGILN
ncbi:MAG: S41 family peptidase [Chitinophagia bacterium]|nr:S41 family peptidase [Chitinophagia bacterium]